jgi:hypothetical protein
VFINNRTGVKQYHLACALTDQYNVECYFLSLLPTGLNWLGSIRQLPKIRKSLTQLVAIRDYFAKTSRQNGSPFLSIEQFSLKRLRSIDPDFVYVSSFVNESFSPDMIEYPILYDIEDSILLDRNIIKLDKYQWRLKREETFIKNQNVKIIAWGSETEKTEALKQNNLVIDKEVCVIYPFVAKRTLLQKTYEKTKHFSVVYSGSVWLENEHRNFIPSFLKIIKQNIDLTVYLLNSFNWRVYYTLKRLSFKHSNFHVKKFVGYNKLKEELSKYHVGVDGNFLGYEKTRATFGMKPLEYAYANVQPASLGHPICNLSDGKEFGYCTTPENIEQKHQNNLKHFDWNYHLMDNRIDKLMRLIGEM